MTAKNWFIYIGDKSQGPFDTNEIRKKISASTLQLVDFICVEDDKDWKRIYEFEEFADILPTYPPGLIGTVSIEGHGKFEILILEKNGFFVEGTKTFPLGTELSFSLKINDLPNAFDMHGVVIGKEKAKQKGFEVEFMRLNPGHARDINQYLIDKFIK